MDNKNHLFVASYYGNTVGEYDATTGATINAAFVPGGPGGTYALALDGSNQLFVANNNTGVCEYDATTGATINEHFIPLHGIYGLAFVSPVPEASTFVLAGLGFLGLLTCAEQRRRRSPYYLNRPKASVI